MRKAEKEIRGEFTKTEVIPTTGTSWINIKNKREKIVLDEGRTIKKIVFADIEDSNLKCVIDIFLLKNYSRAFETIYIYDTLEEGERMLKLGEDTIKLIVSYDNENIWVKNEWFINGEWTGFFDINFNKSTIQELQRVSKNEEINIDKKDDEEYNIEELNVLKKERIGLEELEFLEELIKNSDRFSCIILDVDWNSDLNLWMDLKTGDVSFYSDEEGGDKSIGDIYDIELIYIDDYAKNIIVHKNSEKDVMVIDECGNIGYLPRYIEKSKKQEEGLIEEYKDIEVIPDDKYKILEEPKVYWHDCYCKAFGYCMDKHYQGVETILCHGTCKAPLGTYGHAWVEIEDNIVFDGVLQRFYDKDGYYKQRGAEKEAEYSAEVAYENLIKFNRYDNWLEE